jgi:DNA-binding NarL/FixJ family response regulator
MLEPLMLTKREAEVVTLIFHGMSNPQIARELGRSENTINRHAQNVLEKAGASGKIDLVRIAWMNGGFLY